MNIGVVIVTFNRLDKLKNALSAFENQIYFPKFIVVVNNASTDGTTNFLQEWRSRQSVYKRFVVNVSQNLGGSEGFYLGLEFAVKQNIDWIWVSDDDAYPAKDALFMASQFIDHHNCSDISAISAKVLKNGKIDLDHRRRNIVKKTVAYGIPIDESEYKMEYFECDILSYVGAIIKKDALTKSGLTRRDYFIRYDDTEHSFRLKKEGRLLCVPSVTVYHDVAHNSTPLLFNWKYYYGLRNSLDLYRLHFPGLIYYRYLFKSILLACRDWLLKSRHERGKMEFCAVYDVLRRKFGIHEIYKPGWEPSQN